MSTWIKKNSKERLKTKCDNPPPPPNVTFNLSVGNFASFRREVQCCPEGTLNPRVQGSFLWGHSF